MKNGEREEMKSEEWGERVNREQWGAA